MDAYDVCSERGFRVKHGMTTVNYGITKGGILSEAILRWFDSPVLRDAVPGIFVLKKLMKEVA